MTHVHSAAGQHQRPLVITLILTSLYLVAEVVGAWYTGSLALLADAGHMLTDVGGLAMALLAIRFARRPATTTHSYGYYRAEILAALANAVVLIVISIFILVEAFERFWNPPAVESGLMLGVAVIGLVVNIVGIWILRTGSSESLNVKGAYFEVLADLLSSLGVIAAAGVMRLTGWLWPDAAISAAIGLFILPRTWTLLRQATSVLLEGSPADVEVNALRSAMEALPDVVGVHDLHVWSLTSGMNAMSVHVVCPPGADRDALLDKVHHCVTVEHKISHVTVQVEAPGWERRETHL